MRKILIGALAGACCMMLTDTRGAAHPHVWATVHSDVVFNADGAIAAIRHAWVFDDMFSAFALQGIPHAKKGEYTRHELSGLAKTNVTSLKEYGFFTIAKVGGRKLDFADAADYWLEYKDEALTLHFTLPLKTPVKAPSVLIEIYDPEIFVDLEFAKSAPVALIDAPPQCRMDVKPPHQPTPAEQRRLSDLDSNPLEAGSTYGEIFANKIVVTCP